MQRSDAEARGQCNSERYGLGGRAQLTICVEPSIYNLDQVMLAFREHFDVRGLAHHVQEPRAGNLVVSARALHN